MTRSKKYYVRMIAGILAIAIIIVSGVSYAQARSRHHVETKRSDFVEHILSGGHIDFHSFHSFSHGHATSTPRIRTYSHHE